MKRKINPRSQVSNYNTCFEILYLNTTLFFLKKKPDIYSCYPELVSCSFLLLPEGISEIQASCGSLARMERKTVMEAKPAGHQPATTGIKPFDFYLAYRGTCAYRL